MAVIIIRGFRFRPAFCSSNSRSLTASASASASASATSRTWLQWKHSLGQKRDAQLYRKVLRSTRAAKDLQPPPSNFHSLWIEVDECVSSVGSPETADQLSGATYMHGSPEESMTSKARSYNVPFCNILKLLELCLILGGSIVRQRCHRR